MVQSKSPASARNSASTPEGPGVAFSSNSVRLSTREWFVTGLFTLAVFSLGPGLWETVETFEPGPGHRLPYELATDYWLYERYCKWACSKYETLVVGDSVIWGHYVSKDETLSHHLNEIAGRNQFANLGVDGIHPIALEGLLRYYARDISGESVVLHFNPLWITSRKHDLQTQKEFHFNHPKLVPQLPGVIPCYKASYSKRISAIMQRYVPVFAWTVHLHKTYFDNMDLPTWTLEHPYANPLKAVNLRIPAPDNPIDEIPTSWSEKGMAQRDFQWVDVESSLQWRSFKRSVKMLMQRNNSVFVLVGPFNEHMLKGGSAKLYRNVKREIETWLKQNNVPHLIASALPSELYVDASHPLSRGYALLAKQLAQNDSFRKTVLYQPAGTD